jgi:hypothetical protein
VNEHFFHNFILLFRLYLRSANIEAIIFMCYMQAGSPWKLPYGFYFTERENMDTVKNVDDRLCGLVVRVPD